MFKCMEVTKSGRRAVHLLAGQDKVGISIGESDGGKLLLAKPSLWMRLEF